MSSIKELTPLNINIAISGDLGSGKSLISGKISELIGCTRISVGDIQRKLAEDHKMSTTEFNKYMELHPEIDKEFDQKIEKLGNLEEKYIFDSRMAWHFVPNAFKIHLIVDLDISAKRIFNDKQRVGENYASTDETIANILTRKNSENLRFKNKYSVDCNEFNNYDLVIDTSYVSPEEIIETILVNICKYKKNIYFNKIWLSPRTLYPTQNITNISTRNTEELLVSFKNSGYDDRFPVEAIKCDSYFFIYDGHKRVSCSLTKNISLVPVVIIDDKYDKISGNISSCEFAKTNFELKYAYDWESAHNFTFNVYPFCNKKITTKGE